MCQPLLRASAVVAILFAFAAPCQSVQEFPLPRPGAFPHDPTFTADGFAWYTDQSNSYIGRVDPSSGAVVDFPTPTPGSGPHGICTAPDGYVWYTAQSVGRLGRVDPASGAITEFVLPATANRPHTPVAHQGAIWFTAQTNNTYGRFDPGTGVTQVYPAPIGSLPYGLSPAPDGSLWIALFGTNKLGRVDTTTGALQLFVLPSASARPRRLAVANDGLVWFTDYQRGYLGRLDPSTGALQEWPAPDTPPGPYGISLGTDGRIWFHAAGTNAMIAFDPLAQQFATIPIPTAGAIVRHMVTDWSRGRLWLALSGTARLGLVQLVVPVTTVGAGCAGIAGVPVIAVDGTPRIGSSVTVSVSGTAAPIGVLVFGFSDTIWQGIPLPLELTAFGAPGCYLRVGLDVLFASAPPGPVSVTLPVAPLLNGFLLFAQWAMVADPSGLGFVTSAGVRMRVIGV